MSINENCTDFKKLCRQNTGSNLCDSGSIYGYKYNADLPPSEVYITEIDDDYVSAYIPLWKHLKTFLTIDTELTEWLQDKEEYLNSTFQEDGQMIAEKLDSDDVYEGYTANSDNDLDQSFRYFVIDDKYVLIQTHNGCDSRCGFSDTIVCKLKGFQDIGAFLDISVGWRFRSGTDSEGNEIEQDAIDAMDEDYQPGMDSCLTSKMLEKWKIVGSSIKKDFVILEHEDGTRVEAHPNASFEQC